MIVDLEVAFAYVIGGVAGGVARGVGGVFHEVVAFDVEARASEGGVSSIKVVSIAMIVNKDRTRVGVANFLT